MDSRVYPHQITTVRLRCRAPKIAVEASGNQYRFSGYGPVAKLRLKPTSKNRLGGGSSLLDARPQRPRLRQLLRPPKAGVRTCFIRSDSGLRRCLGMVAL